MEFAKIKFNGSQVELAWATKSGEDEIKHSLASFDPPEPAFRDQLVALVPHVIKLLELPEEYATDLTVTGVSLSRNDSMGLGVVITSQKKLTGATSPFVLNTPYVPEYNESGPSLPTALLVAVEQLEGLAKRYVMGHRAQGDLFAMDEAA